MEKIRFAVAGCGWRAQFYLRLARLLPDCFTLTGVLCHTKESAATLAAAQGVYAVSSLGALLDTRPEFVVSCVSKVNMPQMVAELLQAGVPVLSETPLATGIGELRTLYDLQQRTGTLLELAEQYFLYPTHQARRALLDAGLLGQVTSCQLSMMHDYHAISMLRFYLGEENGRVNLRARQISAPITVTGGRGGVQMNGQLGEEVRTLAQIDYADGRVGLYDFASTQYHSTIRSSHVRLCGTRGELFDLDARYLTDDNRPQSSSLLPRYDAMTGTLRAIDFEGERVYQNPLRTDIPLSEDEIAVGCVLRRMAVSVRGGARHLTLAHAFRDGYLSCLLRGAALEDGRIHSVEMDWDAAEEEKEQPMRLAKA